jgi:hypothetical protein
VPRETIPRRERAIIDLGAVIPFDIITAPARRCARQQARPLVEHAPAGFKRYPSAGLRGAGGALRNLHAVGKHEKLVAVADDLDRWSHDEILERNSARPDNPASLDMV